MRARDRPGQGRWYFVIEPGEDGSVDVYLDPHVTTYETDVGVREYDATLRVVRGVVPWPGMIDDIRTRYDAWCESGEQITL